MKKLYTSKDGRTACLYKDGHYYRVDCIECPYGAASFFELSSAEKFLAFHEYNEKQEEQEITLTAEQVKEFKEFYKNRTNDEARKNDVFNGGAITGLIIAASIFGIELD